MGVQTGVSACCAVNTLQMTSPQILLNRNLTCVFFIEQKQSEAFLVLLSGFSVVVVCLCAREIVVICFSFWPVKIWQLAEFNASWQMMIFLLKKRVCKWKQTSSPAGCSKCYQTSCEKCSQMLNMNPNCVCSGADQLVDSQAIWLLLLHVFTVSLAWQEKC